MSLGVAAIRLIRRLKHFPIDDSFLYNPLRIGSQVWMRLDGFGVTLYKYTLGIVWIVGVCVPGVPLVFATGLSTVTPGLLAVAIAAIVACRCLVPFSASWERDAISFRSAIARLEQAKDWQRFTLHDIVGNVLDDVEIAGEPMRNYRHYILYSASHKSLGTVQLSPYESLVFINQPPPLDGGRKYGLLHECSHIGWANYVNGNETYWTLAHGALVMSTVLGLVAFDIGSSLGEAFAGSATVTLGIMFSSIIFRFGALHAEIEADYGGLKLMRALAMSGDADALGPRSPLGNPNFKPADDQRFNETPWHVLSRSRNQWTASQYKRLLRWAEGPLHPDYAPKEGEVRVHRDPDPWEFALFRRQTFEQIRAEASFGILQPSYNYLWSQYLLNFMAGWVQTILVGLLCAFAPLKSNVSPLTIAVLVGMHVTILAICWVRRRVRMRRLLALVEGAAHWPENPAASQLRSH